MSGTPFNLNEYVRVKLTKRGHELLEAQHRDLQAAVPAVGEYKPPKEEEGWSRWQLWDLMSKLGKHCIMGPPVPFETTIEIEFPK